ncbi:MAG: alpha/beta hydrolase [Salaquimonas sp.]|nr:alpha/beta hydrolase [Salaquimonas sp.]
MSEMQDEQKGWTRLDYSAPDGLQLAGRCYGWDNDDALPVLCLAGLTRNSADFHQLALYLSQEAPRRRKVLSLDYRGRGMSAWDNNWENYNPLAEAEDVLAGTTAAGIEEAAVIGTSRGGMLAMILAAMRPALLKAVILNDVGPEIDGRGLVRIRAYVEKGRDFTNWQDAVEAVEAIGQSQFPNFDHEEWQRQARLIFEEKKGRIVRRYDPKIMKTLTSIDLDSPLPSLWPQFDGLKQIPVLTIRGERSDLLSPETLEKMHEAHPGMQSIIVPDQGHAPDLGTANLPERIAEFITSLGADAQV